jgi:hypothetical protein
MQADTEVILKQWHEIPLTRGHTEEMPKHRGAGTPPLQSQSATPPWGAWGRKGNPSLIWVEDGYKQTPRITKEIEGYLETSKNTAIPFAY